ncbi:MAG: hypothetical protein U1G07_00575 [Verrucomicrobiota bacterium]
MKHRALSQAWLRLVLALLITDFTLLVCGQPETKYIRLRNQLISTPSANRAQAGLQNHAREAPVSGLYLIQFDGRFQAGWRDQLRSLGADLVSYVPDDAFVARVRNAQLAQLRSLPFVRWVGLYRSEFKIHTGLPRSLSTNSPNGVVAVSLLLSPQATAAEVVAAKDGLRQARIQSRTSLGTILRGEITAAGLGRLAQSDAVLWIEPAPRMKLIDEVSSKIVGGGEIPESPVDPNGG